MIIINLLLIIVNNSAILNTKYRRRYFMKKEFNIIGFKKLAKILQMITNVLYWVSIIGMIVSIIAIPVLLLITHGDLTSENFFTGNLSISLDTARGLSFILPKRPLPVDVNLTRLFMSIIGTSFMCCMALMVIFRQVRDILKTVSTDTPFDRKNSTRLLNIGAILIGYSILFNILNSVILMNLIDAFKIYDINVKSSFDIFMLLTGLLMLILAGVFKYGAYLQNEYDTTL
jgi:hypothetical protein